MSPADLAAIHALAFDAPWSAAEFESLLASPGMILCEEPDGFLLARHAADEAEILTLAVAPDRRRRGLGASLVQAAIQQARRRGATRLFLEVAVDNAAAIALYSAAGFSAAGRRPAYYRRAGGAVDALVLSLDL